MQHRYSPPSRLLASLLAVLFLAVSCYRFDPDPDLITLYDRAARHRSPARNPVVVIPGFLGTRLEDRTSGRVVWGAFGGDYASPRTADGLRLGALPIDPDKPLDELTDGVEPVAVLDRLDIRYLRLPLALRAYRNILAALGAGGYSDAEVKRRGLLDYGDNHFTCFQFPYDWRRDVAENAARLGAFLDDRRAFVQAEMERRWGYTDPDLRFDLVTHSMGALVARYYLRYGGAELPDDGPLPPPTWAGAAQVERVVMVAPPNAGALEALFHLVDGHRFVPLLPRYPPAMLGTFPGLYQLLPRGRHGALRDADDGQPLDDELLDPAFWRSMGWGMSDPEQAEVLEILLPQVADAAERRRLAEAQQARLLRRATRLAQALDQPVPPPPGLRLYLVAGDARPTPAVAQVDRRSGDLKLVAHGPGDGSVLRSSALMDERTGRPWSPGLRSPIAWSQVVFLNGSHLQMTKDPVFMDNILFFLLEDADRVLGPVDAD